MYTSEHNKVLHLSALSEDYLAVASQPPFVRIAVNMSREAPALFKHQVGGHRWGMCERGRVSWLHGL